jgi:hypothetical protein
MLSRSAELSRPAKPSRPADLPKPLDTSGLAQGPLAAASRRRTTLQLVADRTPGVAPPGPAMRTAPSRPARAGADWVWSGLGIGAATASAGFAAYMLALAPGVVTPSGNFHLFARYGHGAGGAAGETDLAEGRAGLSAHAVEPSSARIEAAEADTIDPTPTGTLTAPSRGSLRDSTDNQSGQGRYSPNSHPLPDFMLRNVFDGKALVESRSSLSVVKPGSVLNGAGRVLSIERRGGNWVVLTDRGLIAGEPR